MQDEPLARLPTTRIGLTAGVGGVARVAHVPVALAVRLLAGRAIDSSNIAESDFRFASVTDYRSPDFLPGALKYGDYPGLVELSGAREGGVEGLFR